jgi:hypothetical protein
MFCRQACRADFGVGEIVFDEFSSFAGFSSFFLRLLFAFLFLVAIFLSTC